MKKQFQFSHKKLLGICITAIVLIISFTLLFPSNANSPEARNQVIEDYIAYLAEADNASVMRTTPSFKINYVGMGTAPLSSAITLDEAEKAGFLQSDDLSSTNATSEITNIQSIAQQQNALVLEKFGADAWSNVKYTLTYRPPVDGTLGYREISSGKIISEEKYDLLLEKYWKNVAETEGVDYYDLFLRDGESPDAMSEKRVDLISKYMSDIPVEMTLVSDTEETYVVNLSFYGQIESADGFNNFHFVIDNRTGEWEIFEGLTWTEPVPEYPTGD